MLQKMTTQVMLQQMATQENAAINDNAKENVTISDNAKENATRNGCVEDNATIQGKTVVSLLRSLNSPLITKTRHSYSTGCAEENVSVIGQTTQVTLEP